MAIIWNNTFSFKFSFTTLTFVMWTIFEIQKTKRYIDSSFHWTFILMVKEIIVIKQKTKSEVEIFGKNNLNTRIEEVFDWYCQSYIDYIWSSVVKLLMLKQTILKHWSWFWIVVFQKKHISTIPLLKITNLTSLKKNVS